MNDVAHTLKMLQLPSFGFVYTVVQSDQAVYRDQVS
jgi:hypothetical protein